MTTTKDASTLGLDRIDSRSTASSFDMQRYDPRKRTSTISILATNTDNTCVTDSGETDVRTEQRPSFTETDSMLGPSQNHTSDDDGLPDTGSWYDSSDGSGGDDNDDDANDDDGVDDASASLLGMNTEPTRAKREPTANTVLNSLKALRSAGSSRQRSSSSSRVFAGNPVSRRVLNVKRSFAGGGQSEHTLYSDLPTSTVSTGTLADSGVPEWTYQRL